jgi:hypothetical protein
MRTKIFAGPSRHATQSKRGFSESRHGSMSGFYRRRRGLRRILFRAERMLFRTAPPKGRKIENTVRYRAFTDAGRGLRRILLCVERLLFRTAPPKGR